MTTLRWFTAVLCAAFPMVASAQGEIAEGKRAYMNAGCFQCHGTVGQGGAGPRLAPKPMPADAMVVFVRHSARSMPMYDEKVLPEADLRRIHAYLESISPSPTPDQIPQLK